MQTRDAEAKLISKIALTRRLYGHGWSKNDIMSLYRFIDWVMALPPQLEIQYHAALEEIEEELKVEYVTTAERIGISKGIEAGKQLGEIETLLYLLQLKFKADPDTYRLQLEKAKPADLLKWCGRVIECKTIDEVFLG